MNSVAVKFQLKELLETNSLTVYALGKKTGINTNTLYPIYHDTAKRIDKDTVDGILNGLHELTGRMYEVSDLLNYKYEAKA